MWFLTPVEWGLLGFAGFLLFLGIYYEIKGRYAKKN